MKKLILIFSSLWVCLNGFTQEKKVEAPENNAAIAVNTKMIERFYQLKDEEVIFSWYECLNSYHPGDISDLLRVHQELECEELTKDKVMYALSLINTGDQLAETNATGTSSIAGDNREKLEATLPAK